MKSGPRRVFRYSSRYEKALPDGSIRCRMWNIYVVEGQSLQAGFAAFQNAWPETLNPPAITGGFVSALAHPDFLVEMDAVAVVPQ